MLSLLSYFLSELNSAGNPDDRTMNTRATWVNGVNAYSRADRKAMHSPPSSGGANLHRRSRSHTTRRTEEHLTPGGRSLVEKTSRCGNVSQPLAVASEVSFRSFRGGGYVGGGNVCIVPPQSQYDALAYLAVIWSCTSTPCPFTTGTGNCSAEIQNQSPRAAISRLEAVELIRAHS